MTPARQPVCLKIFCILFFSICAFDVVSLNINILYAAPKERVDANQYFAEAKKLFDEGKFAKSAQILRQILLKYPAHAPSLFLAGRIFYRQGFPNKAVKYFKKSGDIPLYQDGAFDYGISFFAVQQCRKALDAFKMVPKDSELRDLAQFYSGVCLYKSQNYNEAELVLRSATDLPNKLESSKAEILRLIAQRRRTERMARSNAAPSVYAPVPLPSHLYAKDGDRPPRPGALKEIDPAKIPKPAMTKKGFAITVNPSLVLSQSSYHAEKHRYTYVDAGDSGLVGFLDTQSRYDFPETFALLLSARADINNKIARNAEIQYVNPDETGDNASVVVQTLADSKTNLKFWTLTLGPGASVQLIKQASLELRFRYWHLVPDMKWVNRRSYQGPFGQLALNFESLQFSLQAAQNNHESAMNGPMGGDLFVAANAMWSLSAFTLSASVSRLEASHPEVALTPDRTSGYKSRMLADSNLRWTLGSYALIAGMEYTIREQPGAEVFINGNESEQKFYGAAEKNFSFGLMLSGNVSYSILPKYIQSVKDGESSNALVQGSGTMMGLKGTLRYSPVEWAYIQSNGFRKSYTYQIGEQKYQESFQKAVIDLEYGYDISVGVNWIY